MKFNIKTIKSISLILLIITLLAVAGNVLNIGYVYAAGGSSNAGQDASGGGSNTGQPSSGGGSNQGQQPTNSVNKIKTLQNPLNVSSVGDLINKVLEIFSYLVIIFAVLALVWVGFQFIMAQGNTERMKELKDWLLAIVIGVAIVIGSRIIVSIVINTLQATGAVDSKIIESAERTINR